MNLSLDSAWTCAHSGSFANATSLPTLSAFSSDSHEPCYLKRSFDLEPTDACVNYVLCLDSAPANISLTLNGQPVPLGSGPPYRVDVTMRIAMEDNTLEIAVLPGVSGHFANLRLEPVPCD